MKRLYRSTTVLLLVASGACAQPAAPPTTATPAAEAQQSRDRASYGIGMNIGRNLATEAPEINLEQLVQGLRDALQGAKPQYTEPQLRAAFEVFSRDAEARRRQRAQTVGDKNKREGQAFLAANQAKAGVATLADGLQYQVLQAGQGASPKATDTVQVHYEGTLIDGTVFDSSIRRGQAAVLAVNGVIPGWTAALQRMRVGDKWRLVLPAELAYGANGAGQLIGPHAVLVFEVELLGIVPAEGAAKP